MVSKKKPVKKLAKKRKKITPGSHTLAADTSALSLGETSNTEATQKANLCEATPRGVISYHLTPPTTGIHETTLTKKDKIMITCWYIFILIILGGVSWQHYIHR